MKLEEEHYPLSMLRYEKYRITPLRKGLVELFFDVKKPMSKKEIQAHLEKRQIPFHRVSLTRDLEFLLDQGIIGEHYLKNGEISYEYFPRKHHHHFVCNKCSDVTDVDLDEVILQTAIEKIQTKLNLSIKSHSLEFFGLCKKCKR